MGNVERVEAQPGFVLHQRRYRESSSLVDAFTRDHGRVAMIAKGARRPRSALAQALQPFRPLLLGWSARGELGTLRTAELDGPPWLLGGAALLSGLYVNELMVRLTHRHDPHVSLYDSYAATLAALAHGHCLESTLRVFEKRLLSAVGYGLILEHDGDTGAPVDREQRYTYRADHGPTLARSAGSAAVGVSGRTLLALAAEQPLDARSRAEAKRLMRFVLAAHLGGRPLASRALFKR